ncbi:hypothetical protein CHH57_01540 [Niallia circulans]|uniref:TRASH domain-containing protein n=1 Tax=Niallia circulans TaxID=1397 RepID=A0AA91TWR4_NIACI|nr:hypothetical protein [Niallia circulans]PAD85021.1 hypothetical protein CHH57_01540 [Niallia circulans]
MIVPNQTTVMKWSNRNKAYYTNLGYKSFENGKEFHVNVEHLPFSSRAPVKFICDYCGENHIATYSGKSKNKNHFCSRNCQDSYLIGKKPWNYSKIDLNCMYCHKKILRAKSDLIENKNVFCSKECTDKFKLGRPLGYRVERLQLKCTYCSSEIIRIKTRVNSGENHFCSRRCADKHKIGKSNTSIMKGSFVNCHTCGNEFYLAKYRIESQDRYFCSNACRLIWTKTDEFKDVMSDFKREQNKLKNYCALCNTETYKYPSEIRGNIIFCSSRCRNEYFKLHNPNPKKEKVKVKCYTCAKIKYVHESVFNKNKYFFCSFDCYQQRRMEISDLKNTGTSIHVKINNLLESIGISYQNEKVFGYYSMDIYLPDYQLGIEIMGDYWHASPIRYESVEYLNDMQAKNAKKDSRKRNYIENKYNTKILYLWEKDINKNSLLCEKLIEFYILKNGILDDYNSFNYHLTSNGSIVLNNTIIQPYFMVANTQFQVSHI